MFQSKKNFGSKKFKMWIINIIKKQELFNKLKFYLITYERYRVFEFVTHTLEVVHLMWHVYWTHHDIDAESLISFQAVWRMKLSLKVEQEMEIPSALFVALIFPQVTTAQISIHTKYTQNKLQLQAMHSFLIMENIHLRKYEPLAQFRAMRKCALKR